MHDYQTYTEDLKLHIDFKTLAVLWCDLIYLYIYFCMYVCIYVCVCVCLFMYFIFEMSNFVVKRFYEACLIISLGNVDILKMTQKYLKRVWWTYNEFICNKRGYAHTNITLRHVRVTIVAVERNTYFILQVCVCSVIYPACNVRAPYCILWHFRCYSVFPLYFIKARFSGKKKLLSIKCVFDFLYKFFLTHFSF